MTVGCALNVVRVAAGCELEVLILAAGRAMEAEQRQQQWRAE